MKLWVVAATWNSEMTDLLCRGGVNLCSVDRVRFLLDGERDGNPLS
jgi:hypothetical protein